jgi:long-chain fatty acid transport protein
MITIISGAGSRNRRCSPLLLAGVAILLPLTAAAVAIRLPNQDAEAIARGNAFVATANNPSALYYNPAGITQLEGQNLQVGVLNYFGITAQYQSPAGTRSETEFELVPVPQFYYTYTPKDYALSFGLGLYSPFGLGAQWPENSGFRSLAIEGRLQYITVNPVLALKLHPTLSLAIGPTINYSKLKLRRGLLSTTPGGDELRFKGDDFDYGFNAGLLWQPHEKWSFGANYRSDTSLNYKGTASYYNTGLGIPSTTVDSSARVQYPQIVSAGVSFRPTPKWNIEVNADWTDWETLNTVTLDGTRNFGFFGPSDLQFPLNWHNSWFYEIGATRYFENGYFASAGYFYSSKTTGEKDFNPIVADTDLHVGSVGAGYKGPRWRWALAFQIITGPYRDVKTSQPNPYTGESANGKYRFIVPTITGSLGYHF